MRLLKRACDASLNHTFLSRLLISGFYIIMKKTSTFTLAFTALLAFDAHSETLAAPTPTEFVPSTHKVVEIIGGDLNKDGQEDIVLLIKATDKSMVSLGGNGQEIDRNRRGLVIAFWTRNGYILALKHPNCFSSENEDGGVYFPPDLSVTTKNNSLFIHYAHGRYGYWGYNFRFQNADFELIGYDSSNNRGPVTESTVSINLLSNKILKKVNINAEAQGGDERFKEVWSKIKEPRSIKLSEIANFDEFYIEQILGLTD